MRIVLAPVDEDFAGAQRAPPAGTNPLGALLGVVGAAFIVGIFARRRAEEAEAPATRIRGGIAGLGEQAGEKLASLLDRARWEIQRRVT